MQIIAVKKPTKTAVLGRRTPQTATITQNFTNETGLYYYGARYLDPKTSRWLSGDPALGEYVPRSGQDIAKLPGMGGVYNYVNLHTYHYSANNPVKYTDPDGRLIKATGDDGITYTWDNEKNDFYTEDRRKNKIYGTEDSFINDVKNSIIYAKNSGQEADNMISELSSKDVGTTLIKRKGNTGCRPQEIIFKRGMDVYYNPNNITQINDGTDSFNSPSLGLFHEIVHSYSHVIENSYIRRWKDTKSVDPRNVNAEEKYAMDRTNGIARLLGEPVREYYNMGSQASRQNIGVTTFRNNQRH
jgi:RHS repeat-associated protein